MRDINILESKGTKIVEVTDNDGRWTVFTAEEAADLLIMFRIFKSYLR